MTDEEAARIVERLLRPYSMSVYGSQYDLNADKRRAMEAAASLIEHQAERIKELEGALRPFAEFLDAAERLGGPSGYRDGAIYAVTAHNVGTREITGLDLKRARVALNEKDPSPG